MNKTSLVSALIALVSLATLNGCAGSPGDQVTINITNASPEQPAPVHTDTPDPIPSVIVHTTPPAPTTPAADAGNDTETPECDTTLRVDIWRDGSRLVRPGDQGEVVMRMRFTAPACSALWVNQAKIEMKAVDYPDTDSSPFCASGNCLQEGDFTFQHFRLVDAYTLTTLSTGVLAARTSNQQLPIQFVDPFLLQAGEVKEVTVVTDVFGGSYNYGVGFRAYLGYVVTGSGVTYVNHDDNRQNGDQGLVTMYWR